MKRGSQCNTILDYLKTGKGITQIEATRLWDITRLAARVSDLRKRNYPIASVREGVGFGSYVRYYLDEEWLKEYRRQNSKSFRKRVGEFFENMLEGGMFEEH
jgi:hypothetical protein